MRESFGILSLMLLILTFVFWLWIVPLLPINGQQGTNLIGNGLNSRLPFI